MRQISSTGPRSLATVILMALAVLAVLVKAAPAQRPDAPGPGASRTAAPLPVEFVAVARRPLTFDMALTGTIAARDSIALSFPQGGKIIQVLVDAGDRVREGQVLARLDPVQQQQALAAAQASLGAALASLEQAQQAATRSDEMLRRGVGTAAARDNARRALSAAEGEAERARIAVDQASRAREDTELTAPQAAVVTVRSGEPGQIVGPAQDVLQVAALTGLEAVFQAPDGPDLDAAMGAAVMLHPLDRPGTTLTATVSEIAPLVDPATGAVTVRATIPGPTDTSLLGAAVRGSVRLPVGTGIVVPWTALTVTGDQPAVWRVGPDGRATLTPVTVERFQTEVVILQSGVEPGDTVVGEGSQMMFPGRRVTAGQVRP